MVPIKKAPGLFTVSVFKNVLGKFCPKRPYGMVFGITEIIETKNLVIFSNASA